ncbi:MAG: hypothetical protein EOO99_01765 [Pedobacter sp.]|nr:MAG: hypothetical protein EOO99_01765 [Pedobacter sp.]
MNLKSILFSAFLASIFCACKKEEDPVMVLPPAESITITLDGKTETSAYANVVYLDLSTKLTKSVDRKSWNIAIANGAIKKVFINPSYQSTAVVTNKFNLNEINLDNPGTDVNLNHNISDPTTVSLVDYWDGSLDKTAYAGEVLANDAENKVYLLSFEGNKEMQNWFKFKITKTANGTQIEYGRLNDSQFKTIQVPNDEKNVLSFVSLENDRLVVVEPEIKKWDLAWGYSTNDSGLGSPYWVQDFVWTNSLMGVKVAEVMNSAVSYADFGILHLSGYNLVGFRNIIGTSWRSTQPATGVKTDRFYIIQDADGLIFKLKFVSMGLGDGGERGRPVVEYQQIR